MTNTSLFHQAGFASVSLNALDRFEHLTLDLEIGEDEDFTSGFMYIYVANESSQDIYFDDIQVTHESATSSFKVSQINEYYPFGLTTSRSWRNAGYVDPGLLYQSSYASYDSVTGYYDFLSRSYDPVLGRFFAVDPAGQFGSPYVGMGNVPHMGIDPDGEFAWFIPLIAAAINVGVNAAQGKIDNFWEGLGYAAIGAAGSFAGFGAGQAVAGAVGTASSLGGAIANGAITGAAGGFAGGFVGGAGNAWVGGVSFSDGLGAGLQAGGYGAITGGVIGGISGGVQYGKQTAAFRKGNGELGVQSGDPVPATDDFLNQAQEAWYPDAPMEHVGKFTVENVPESHLTGKNGLITRGAAAKAVPLSRNGILTGQSNVYFNKDLAFTSAKRLFFSMGHEFVHVSQYASLAGQASSLLRQPGFIDLIEYHAYSYEYNVLGSSNYGGFTPVAVGDLMRQFPNYFHTLSYTNYPWTTTANFIYPFR